MYKFIAMLLVSLAIWGNGGIFPLAHASSWVAVTHTGISDNGMHQFIYEYGVMPDLNNKSPVDCGDASTKCLIAPFYEGGTLSRNYDGPFIRVDNIHSVGYIEDAWVKAYGSAGTAPLQTTQAGAVTACWGFMYFGGELGQASPGRRLPGSTCVKPNPEPNVCSLTPTALVIDFGVKASVDIPDATEEVDVSIDCTYDATVRLLLGSADVIRLNSSSEGDTPIDATLTIGGKPLRDTPIPISGGKAKPVSLRTTLRNTGELVSGEYTGSDVLLLTIE
ncbi:TPA: hypothetical protein ACXJQO_002594 [Serratia marcescens]